MDTENKKYEEDFNLRNIASNGNVSTMDVFDAPMGPGRYDKGVIVSDGSLSMRTSNLMTGKQNILVDDKYFNVEDIMMALESYLKDQDIGVKKKNNNESTVTIIECKRTGKKVSVESFLGKIKAAIAGSDYNIKVGDSSPNIKNQNSARVTFSGKGEKEDSHRGLFMLGNKGLQLSKGDYKLAADIEKALNEYMLVHSVSRKVPSPGFKPRSPYEEYLTNKDKIYIAKRTKKKYSLIPALIPIIMSATMAFSMIPGKKVSYSPGNTTASVNVEQMVQVPITGDEAIQEALSKTTLGSNIVMNKGTKFFNSSDHEYGGDDRSGEFGKGLRESGNYVIEYLSIINKNTGEIIKAVYEENKNIGKEVNKVLKDNNLSFSDVDIKVHIGGPVSGWIDIRDIDSLQKNSNKVKINVEQTYKVIENDFQGSISFKNQEGKDVVLNILDSNGYILPSNSIVMGSDGNTYKIHINSIKQLPDKKIVTDVAVWDLSLEKALKGALAGTGLATILSAVLAELNKEEKTKRISKSQYVEAKEKYEEKSSWTTLKPKIIARLFNKKANNESFKNKKIEVKFPNIITTDTTYYSDYSEDHSRGGR